MASQSRSSHPATETMREIFARYDRLPAEIEQCRLEARRLQDQVADKKREVKIATHQALTRLAGTGDAHSRKKAAEAEVADLELELDRLRSRKASAWSAWKERLEQYEAIKAIANAYNRELRELGG